MIRRSVDSHDRIRLGSSFWKLFAASASTNLADGIGTMALPLLAASRTTNTVLISGLTSLTFLPWLLFGLPGGALVDRLDRRMAMATVNLARAGIIAVFATAVLLGQARIAWLYLVAFVLGLGEVLYESAARATLPQVVPRQQLDAANGWLTVEETIGQSFLGGPVGSILFAVVAAAPFLANATGFAVAGLLVLLIPGHFRPARRKRSTLRADIRDGMSWLWHHPVLRAMTVYRGVIAALMSMATSLNVLYVLHTLHLPAAAYGVFLLTGGIGGLLGSAIVRPLTARFGRVVMLPATTALGPVMFVLLGAIPEVWAAGLFFLGLSAGVTMANVLSMSLRQAMIPEHLLGRVLGADRVVLWGGIPLGALVGGALANWTGVPPVYLISGAVQLVVALLIYRLMRRNRDRVVASFDNTATATA